MISRIFIIAFCVLLLTSLAYGQEFKSKTAPEFSLKDINGNKVSLSDFYGEGPIYISFWATWCKPCVKGIPHLKKFYKEYKDIGFEILGISLDSKKEDLDEYLSKDKLERKIAYSGKGWMDDTARFYNVNLIPSYWLIDRKGILRNFGIPLRDKETLKKSIEKLISEPRRGTASPTNKPLRGR